MFGRTPAAAVTAYVNALQRAVACVTREVLRPTGYGAADAPHALLLARGSPVALSSRLLPIALEVRERFTFSEAPAGAASRR